MHTFARWVSTPENRAARTAVGRVVACVCARRQRREINPLLLHGPSGTGKTHLVSALVTEITRQAPDLVATVLSAGDFAYLGHPENDAGGEGTETLLAARQCDLLVVEDVQHLPLRAVETLVQLFDGCLARQQQMIFTAPVGPRQLVQFPARWTSRLACGLVVGLEPLAPASRLTFLQDRADRRQLAVGRDVLAWLAEHVGGSGRQLEGAIGRVETLVRLHDRLPDVATVAGWFRTEADAATPTVERIAERVSGYYQLEPRQLQSRRRYRNALLPRQVGMYLARQLTRLSLDQIGAYFGGRDHSTVLHACRKVEQALTRDVALNGAVRQLHADLT